MKNEIQIHNVVASCKANARIPLSRLAMGLEGTEYEPEQFPGLVIRLKEPKSAALIFNSGKIVCTGTTSMDQAKKAVDSILKKIKSLKISIKSIDKISIQNIVASANVGSELNLNLIAFKMEGTEYEPEQFPGLVYRLDDPKVVFLLFSSGKVICTGGKSKKMVETSVEKLKKNLKGIGAI